MILFDTDTCIEILRGNHKTIKKRAAYPGEISISFMTAAELFYGAENSKHPAENRAVVEKFLLTLEVIHSDLPILRKFGEIKSDLRGKNLLIPDADIFVAATALETSEALVTGNSRHFERIDGLKIENWVR